MNSRVTAVDLDQTFHPSRLLTVTGSNLEPVQGLVDNWFGPARLMTLSALGVGRTMYAEYDNNLDIIPVDYGCNLILVAATRAEKYVSIV